MDLNKYFPGFVFISVIGLLSLVLSTLHPSFDALVISIIFGMFAGNIENKNIFKAGSEIGIKYILPLGIALYGMQVSSSSLSRGLIFGVFIIFAAMFTLTFLLAKTFNISRTTSILLSTGLSVCGASAIAIISPLIGAEKEETSISIIAVMMLGLTGMLLYPILFDFFPVSANEFNFIAGTTLPMIGQVKVAATAYCPDCVEKAIQIKLIRISLLVFLAPLAAMINREHKRFRLPWFIIVFIILAVIVNTNQAVQALAGTVKYFGTFCLAAGLASIGFSVDLNALIEKGHTPFLVVFSSWLVLLIIIYLSRTVF